MKKTGRRNRPCFRISVADRRSPRDGRTLDTLGLYDPVAPDAEKQITLDVEKAKDWISRGAQPSDTVRSIFKRQGVFEGQPEHKARKRPGRYKTTAKNTRRKAVQEQRAEAKKARRAERDSIKSAAKAAAKAAEGGGDSEE